MNAEEGSQIDWLLAEDPAIRWQVMRDLQGLPTESWQAERARVANEGWGKQLLDRQDEAGTWGGGIYSPKWTSTTYTLLMLIEIGIDPENEQCRRGTERILTDRVGHYSTSQNGHYREDQCVLGFYLSILSYFRTSEEDSAKIVNHLLLRQMDDGGWNCRRDKGKAVRHSSFHTTFNVLEGLRMAAQCGTMAKDRFLAAEARAIEFMLEHRLYKSDRTGEVVNHHFTEFSYPYRWHYDVLRGLDYIRSTPFRHDARLEDALDLLKSKHRNGIWPAEDKHAGKEFFTMESPARQSRWNTLRATRVLRDCSV